MSDRIADAGDRLALARLESCATVDQVGVRRGSGWTGLLTGVLSNDWNGVVCRDPDLVRPDGIDDLVRWFADVGAPACWLMERPDARLGGLLAGRGLRPERTGWWAGLSLSAPPPGRSPARVAIRPVCDAADLDRWLDVADACGWLNGAVDRGRRRDLYLALGLEGVAWRYWIALRDDRAVGMASSFRLGTTVELLTLAVVSGERRYGIGSALTARALRDGVESGCSLAVAAPSPDGWQLYQRLGFTSTPVAPDVCWYFPSQPTDSRQ